MPASIEPASTQPVTMALVTIEPALEPAATSFDDHAADFFREGDAEPAPGALELDNDFDTGHAHGAALGQTVGGAARPRDVARAAAAARRRAFSRHVMIVVALSAMLCIAGFVRSATSASAASARAAAEAQRAANVVSLTPFVVANAPAPTPVPAPTETAAPAATETAAPAPSAATVAPAASASTDTVAPAGSGAAPAELSPVEARAAREDARRALDRGAVAAAIAAGTRSVELDPTDGDAWLLLGAAYQLAGKAAEARNAFSSCTKLAKRGDVGECRAFAF